MLAPYTEGGLQPAVPPVHPAEDWQPATPDPRRRGGGATRGGSPGTGGDRRPRTPGPRPADARPCLGRTSAGGAPAPHPRWPIPRRGRAAGGPQPRTPALPTPGPGAGEQGRSPRPEPGAARAAKRKDSYHPCVGPDSLGSPGQVPQRSAQSCSGGGLVTRLWHGGTGPVPGVVGESDAAGRQREIVDLESKKRDKDTGWWPRGCPAPLGRGPSVRAGPAGGMGSRGCRLVGVRRTGVSATAANNPRVHTTDPRGLPRHVPPAQGPAGRMAGAGSGRAPDGRGGGPARPNDCRTRGGPDSAARDRLGTVLPMGH